MSEMEKSLWPLRVVRSQSHMSALGHNRSVAIFSQSRPSRLYSARPVTFLQRAKTKPPARRSASTHIGLWSNSTVLVGGAIV